MVEIDQINVFFDDVFPDSSRQSVQYGLLSPGSYEYLVRPSTYSLRWLANRVSGNTYRRTAAEYVLRMLATVNPPLFSSLPKISDVELKVPVDCCFDIAIFGMRLKLLDFGNGRVYTLPLNEPSLADTRTIEYEARIRRSLPNEINSPPVYEFDPDFPYLIEAFVTGETPTSVIDDWSAILNGLEQLRDLYRITTVGFTETGSILDNMFNTLETVGAEEDEVVERVRRFLKKHPLPNQLRRCQIHGDYQTGNLLVSNDKTYILDWEFSHVDLCLIDCFTPFKRHSLESDDGGPLAALVTLQGPYRDIAADLAETIGPLAYGADTYYETLPVLYLLYELTAAVPDVTLQDHFAYGLLTDILNTIDA